MNKTSEADKFLSEPNNYRDTNHIMESLDACEIPSNQDWQNETTTWTFGDGSKIVICGNEVDTVDADN